MEESGIFCLKVSGENACFTRPEMKVERVSYEVITPSAARGIFEAILWKPAIKWKILQIDVLNSVKWESVRRNEVGKVVSSPSAAHINGESKKELGFFIEENRQQRAGLFLKDVSYVIHAKFEITERAGSEDSVVKFQEMFIRRASNGQCFHNPYFGCREFPVYFEFVSKDTKPHITIPESKDLGWMLYDMDYRGKEAVPMFFHAVMNNGIIDLRNVEVKS